MPKPGLVNRQAVGTYRGKLHSRQSGAYGAGRKNTSGEQAVPGARAVSTASKASRTDKEAEGQEKDPTGVLNGPIDRIAPSLRGLIVPIGSLMPDPDNARLHPERNLQSIKDSLNLYGQRKALAVIVNGKGEKVVRAGNGTLEAAKALGWTKLAAAVDDDLTEVEAMGYGLADNRTAELARWDFEVVARIDKLLQDNKQESVGWSVEELQVLRANEFTMPAEQAGGQTWQELWKGMPEFDQQDLTSFRRIVVHFRNDKDVEDFLTCLGQLPGDVSSQKSIWYPRAEIDKCSDKRYVSR